jgi:hypothetical protein
MQDTQVNNAPNVREMTFGERSEGESVTAPSLAVKYTATRVTMQTNHCNPSNNRADITREETFDAMGLAESGTLSNVIK